MTTMKEQAEQVRTLNGRAEKLLTEQADLIERIAQIGDKQQLITTLQNVANTLRNSAKHLEALDVVIGQLTELVP